MLEQIGYNHTEGGDNGYYGWGHAMLVGRPNKNQED